jgi:hypothetical protein
MRQQERKCSSSSAVTAGVVAAGVVSPFGFSSFAESLSSWQKLVSAATPLADYDEIAQLSAKLCLPSFFLPLGAASAASHVRLHPPVGHHQRAIAAAQPEETVAAPAPSVGGLLLLRFEAGVVGVQRRRRRRRRRRLRLHCRLRGRGKKNHRAPLLWNEHILFPSSSPLLPTLILFLLDCGCSTQPVRMNLDQDMSSSSSSVGVSRFYLRHCC